MLIGLSGLSSNGAFKCDKMFIRPRCCVPSHCEVSPRGTHARLRSAVFFVTSVELRILVNLHHDFKQAYSGMIAD